MPTVSELLSQNVAQIISDVQTWSIFYNALEQGCEGDGTTDDYAALNTLFNQTITTDALVIFPRGASGYRIGSNLVVPSNVVLYFVGEATLKPDSGVTVEINGGIIAGVYQIFSGLGTIIGNPIVEKVFPQWWGAVGDGVTSDNAAITAMKNTLTANGGTAFFPKGDYLVTNSALLTPPANVTYVGDAALSNFKVGSTLTSIPAYSIIPGLTANRAVVSNGSGIVSSSAVTGNELLYLSGVTGNIQTQFTGKQSTSEKDSANGYAGLDSGAKILISQIPDSIVGQIEYQGTWDASTNTPTLASASTVKGYYYIVSVAGTYLSISYDVGDWIVSNGTIWQKIDNTDAVTTVFGRLGAIVANTNDYTWAQINKATSSLADLTTRSAADLSDGSVSDLEYQSLNGVTSPIQAQLDSKAVNAFSTISVSGQSDVVADQKADVLTLKGGIGITITTNPTTDEVTVTATGSAAPGPHAITHITGGTDVIDDAVDGGNSGLMSGEDKAKLNLVTNTELGYVAGVTSPLQTQIDAKSSTSSLNSHIADYSEHVPYGGTTTGSANTYVLAAPSIAALTLGMAVSVKFNVDSTGASTLNWDGKGAKGIKKPNGTDATNLKATGIYTLRYDGTNFILQGEGGGGNAVAAHLLAGETATVDSGDIVGTMVDHSGVYTENNLVDGTFTANRLYLRPPIGFYDGVYSVYADDPNFIAANWPNGVSVFGLVGTGVNVKRVASGIGTSNGSKNLIVSGLSFTPSIVIVGGVAFTSSIDQDKAVVNLNTGKALMKVIISDVGTKTNGANLTVGAGTFTMVVFFASTSYEWLAIE